MATTDTTSAAYLAEDRRSVLVGESIGCAVFTTFFLLLRFYAKRFQGPGGFFADDAFLLAAYVVNLGLCAVGIIIVQVGGVGRHMAFNELNDPDALTGWAKTLFAFELAYFVSICLPKLSILCLYLRLFSWKGATRTVAWILFVLTALTSTALVLAACFQCIPLAFFWDRTIPGGRCFDIQMFFHAQALPGSVLDVAILVLPISTIWGLKMPLLKRLALVFVFGLAGFGIVASLIRATKFFGTEAFSDETWASVDLIGWSIIETSVYIITCCLPHLKPLISHYTPQAVKKACHSWIHRSTTGTSKGFSGIVKSTAFSHSHQSRSGKDEPVDDAIELTRTRGSESWTGAEDDFDRGSSPELTPLGLRPSLRHQQDQALGVTTEISAGNANRPGV